ncbi:MAG: pyruvate, phosphate dikinase [Alphaproteobacteria bacterium]|nr:pyruvate, phosphate dikinase [Alphaproteobacteria bacterium]
MADRATSGLAPYPIKAGVSVPPEGAIEVGNKARNLIRMASAGLPVPAGFVLSTAWTRKVRAEREDDTRLVESLAAGIDLVETATGLRFGSARRPLLVAVRSSPPVSMPGMLETVLDVGLNAETVDGLIRLTGNPRLAWDCYRRLIQGFAQVVQGLPTAPFNNLMQAALGEAGVTALEQLDHRSLRRLTRNMLDEYRALAGRPFPQDPREQLRRAAAAVFRSWDAEKATTYRRLNQIDEGSGTAVTVQNMVFGNAGGDSGAGVGFTRNPATGERQLYLDFQFGVQGEDVVAGRQVLSDPQQLRGRLPETWKELEQVAHRLEALFRDAQDFEFTLQDTRLSVLQTRDAKRTPWAALRIAVDLAAEGVLGPEEALARLHGLDVQAVKRTRFSGGRPTPVAVATVASLGVASGAIALDTAAAERLGREGAPVILVRAESTTADIAGIAKAAGILTGSGGRTSHAAVVARELAKVCLVGCPSLSADPARRICRIGGQTFAEGDFISLDGDGGAIYPGRLAIVAERPERELAIISGWHRAA